jgi:Holliday junction resolvase RusA-like endonuclease
MTSDNGIVKIVLLGTALPYRHRSAATGHRYLPTRQRDQLAALRLAAAEAMTNRVMFDEPVMLDLHVEAAIPRSWSGRKQRAALQGSLLPSSRPDLSNILKLSEDALSGVVLRDDALVCIQQACKRYGSVPKIILTVRPISNQLDGKGGP